MKKYIAIIILCFVWGDITAYAQAVLRDPYETLRPTSLDTELHNRDFNPNETPFNERNSVMPSVNYNKFGNQQRQQIRVASQNYQHYNQPVKSSQYDIHNTPTSNNYNRPFTGNQTIQNNQFNYNQNASRKANINVQEQNVVYSEHQKLKINQSNTAEAVDENIVLIGDQQHISIDPNNPGATPNPTPGFGTDEEKNPPLTDGIPVLLFFSLIYVLYIRRK